MFEKYGQNAISTVIVALILWVGNSLQNLEKQAIRSEAQANVSSVVIAQLSKTVDTLALRLDNLQARQEAMALEAAKKNKE